MTKHLRINLYFWWIDIERVNPYISNRVHFYVTLKSPKMKWGDKRISATFKTHMVI